MQSSTEKTSAVKRILTAAAAGILLLLALAGCRKSYGDGSSYAAAPAQSASVEQSVTSAVSEADPVPQIPAPVQEAEVSGDTEKGRRDTLVIFFSATGTTKGVAERITAVTGADLYEIKAAEPYTADDLDYGNRNSRATREQGDPTVRPAIGSGPVSPEAYSRVFVGFPIWWGEEPRILDTFAESHSFGGATVIPFCTSGSSGIGRSGRNLEALAGSGIWLDGRRFSGSVSESELRSWIEGLG